MSTGVSWSDLLSLCYCFPWQGLKAPEDSEQRKTSNVAVNWKRKLYYHRTLESIVAPLGSRGLRKLNRSHISTPSIVDTLQSATTL